MKTVIMAGGKGTRIASVASDIPKPMIKVCGKPILEWQIENLRSCELTDITLVTGHLGHVIRDYFGDGKQLGVTISYFEETQPLGTAGALFCMPELMEGDDDFLLMCGDIIVDVDFNRFLRFHREHNAWASLMAHPNGHPYDSSLLITETLPPTQSGGCPVETHLVTGWLNKEDKRLYYKNRVNAGIEIISSRLLRAVREQLVPRHPDQPGKIDLDRDVLKPSLASGRIFAYDTSEYIKDMGTPDRLHEVERDIASGKVTARNLREKQRAIFLDRDGTLNRYVGFLTTPEQLELLEGAAEAVKAINASKFLAVVITNQPVIARGECSWEQLQTIHHKLETELGREGAFVDAIYVCPHHPDKGFEGERPEYKFDCDCRKPKAGLLLQAAADMNISLADSYIIGDDMRDVQAGINAGCKDSIRIETNLPGALFDAVRQLIDSIKPETANAKKSPLFLGRLP